MSSGSWSMWVVRTRGPRVAGAEMLVEEGKDDIDQRIWPDDLLSAWNLPSTEATRTMSRRSRSE